VAILPFVNSALAGRRPFLAAVESLRLEGVRLLLGVGEWQPHPPGEGNQAVDSYPWHRALAAINCPLKSPRKYVCLAHLASRILNVMALVVAVLAALMIGFVAGLLTFRAKRLCPSALKIYMTEQMFAAIEDLSVTAVLPSTEIYDRFLAWTAPRSGT
jgi:hypothetical protein